MKQMDMEWAYMFPDVNADNRDVSYNKEFQ
jgi:hypothetical protein